MNRQDDLIVVFDKTWKANHNDDIKKAKEREQEFMKKMFGNNNEINTKQNSSFQKFNNNQVNNLQNNINGFKNIQRQNMINNITKK